MSGMSRTMFLALSLLAGVSLSQCKSTTKTEMSTTPESPNSSSTSAPANNDDRKPHFRKQGELAFIRANGNDTISKIDIELATSDSARQRGLMDRPNIDENTGMLFIFDRPERQSFWMHNTPSSLDIMFIGPDRQILNIHEFAAPMSDDPQYPSAGLSNLVLEVVGGYCKKHGVKAGDRIDYKIIE